MKNLNYYTKRDLNNEGDVFNYLINTLKDSIFTWEYFVDFTKVNRNTEKFANSLEIMNSLIGLGDKTIDAAFEKIVVNHPTVREVLPILIASRTTKIGSTPIIDDVDEMTAQNKKDIFDPRIPIDDSILKDLLLFFEKTGLRQFFIDKKITNLVDYCKGVEVGMDTNARKNRTGTNMENLLEKVLIRFCRDFNFRYLSQATKNKIYANWNIDIKVDKINRRFDFALLSPTNQLVLMEVNYYGSGGSKLKATAGEYKSLQQLLANQSVKFIWVTDGKG
ncbi:type II restriction endonuclease [Virgibacillus sp. 179-BFC.A HS]|uniref:Type-2 restriction enzyme n=1 Tax=Tigheibacillus jepli TaxID=3035914 RepID=A0ABU5CGF8_9BACI|nr:type II restriction endonuclease [Virgibacillus sp. 179-BFC.A HS]MDY0404663.1 type II restriction endonuclease [Virgibacillus sp. 179-BFC.A HS]